MRGKGCYRWQQYVYSRLQLTVSKGVSLSQMCVGSVWVEGLVQCVCLCVCTCKVRPLRLQEAIERK